jgi:hypothetical protein
MEVLSVKIPGIGGTQRLVVIEPVKVRRVPLRCSERNTLGSTKYSGDVKVFAWSQSASEALKHNSSQKNAWPHEG